MPTPDHKLMVHLLVVPHLINKPVAQMVVYRIIITSSGYEPGTLLIRISSRFPPSK
jgi:hypothetical protein